MRIKQFVVPTHLFVALGITLPNLRENLVAERVLRGERYEKFLVS